MEKKKINFIGLSKEKPANLSNSLQPFLNAHIIFISEELIIHI